MTTKNDLLKMGLLFLKEQEHREKVKALKQKQMECGFLSFCFTEGPNGSTHEIRLDIYLALFLDAEPKLNTYQYDNNTPKRVYLMYPTQFIAELKPGYSLWVEAKTPIVEMPSEKPVQEAVA